MLLDLLEDGPALGVVSDNYEGLALGPRLADGRQVLLMVNDDNTGTFVGNTIGTTFLAFAYDPGTGGGGGAGPAPAPPVAPSSLPPRVGEVEEPEEVADPVVIGLGVAGVVVVVVVLCVWKGPVGFSPLFLRFSIGNAEIALFFVHFNKK